MARTAARAAAALAALLVHASTAAASAGSSAASQADGGISSVQKVIQMLTDMSAKAKKEKNNEEVAFAKFSTWCTDEKASLANDIQKNTEDMDLLQKEISKLDSDVTVLGKGIAELHSSVDTHSANKKAEVNQRAKDHEDFLAQSKDYEESVDALERAILVLQKQDYDRTSKAALVQLSEKQLLPAKAQSLVQAFLGMLDGDSSAGGRQDPLSYEAPEANAYEFQSGNIVELLKKLRDEFKGKLGDCRKEEMNSKHASSMIVSDLTNTIENQQKEIEEKTVLKQRKAEQAALDKKQLTETTAIKAENKKTLSATTTSCGEKQLSFAEKQKLRAEEIEAIEKAVEILSAPEVLGHAEKYLSLAQPRSGGTALVQMGDRQDRNQGFHRRVREFLAGEARRLRSQRLGLLVQKMAADPFAKVKQLIDGLITRLLEEAKGDADHEGWCDTEMGKSRVTRTRLSEEIDGLSAAVAEGKATIAAFTESTTELTRDVADLVKSMGEAEEMRKQEKAANAATIKDAEAAQAAVQAATAVLKEFYAKALTATALIQQQPADRRWGLKTNVKMGSEEWKSLADPKLEGTVDTGHKEGMQAFGELYQGRQEEEEYGVVALLEAIQSDFANLQADTQAGEIQSSKAHEQFMTESQKNKAVKERKIEMNNADQASTEARLQEDTADQKATQDRLLAAQRYYDKLVPQCKDQGMTFQERTKAREDEITSLKQALEILSSDAIATSAL